jgi:GNAT superfamily N-acetyltransferase
VISYPLTPQNRQQLADAFRNAPRVDIAIDCVLAGTMGNVFVDDDAAPTAFQIAFPPFYYFAGEPGSSGGQEMIRRQNAHSLLMPSAPGWQEAFQREHGPRLVAMERYSFSPAALDPGHLADLVTGSPFQSALVRLDRDLALALADADDGVVDLSAFASVGDFLENGCGHCLLEEGAVTGVAFSSLAHPEAIEISIFVEPAQRQQGRATALGAALAGTALARGQTPHWDAANPESVRLAEKLGYRFTRSYEAHWLVI